MTVQELARMLLPRSRIAGGFGVLTAYFDDSGTHDGSDVTLMGGLFGNDYQWEVLEIAWNKLLAAPGDGWEPLRRFHMYDCEHGLGEFFGHTRGARDHLIYRFRNLILDAGLHGYSMGVSAPDWARLVLGEKLAAWGDAERFCVTNCLLQTLAWAQAESVETEVAFVFDDRPQRREANRRVYSIYQHYAETENVKPTPMGLSFLNSDKAIPLQAADMFAWEGYRYTQDWLLKREKAKSRPHFSHFLKTDRFRMQCGTPEAIAALVESVKPGSFEDTTIGRLAAFFSAPSSDVSLARPG